MSSTTTVQSIPRQGHRKSRKGCSRCKQRRVKCDEQKPCSNCVRRNESCDLLLPRVPYRCPNCVGRDFKAASTLQSPTALDSPLSSTETNEDAFTTTILEWNRDMYLMNHWSLHTAGSITESPRMRKVWTEFASELAVDHPMVTKSMLTLSALHLAYLRPGESSNWLPLSFKHQMAVIAAFREAIPTISKENCDALFAVASLISVASMAWSSRTKLATECLTVQDLVEPFFLTRGVGEVVGAASVWIRHGPMQILLEGHFIDVDVAKLHPGTAAQFQRLADMIATAYADDRKVEHTLTEHLGHLRRIYAEVQVRRDHVKDEFGTVWKFASMSSCEFVALLREPHPCALVLYAHFAVLSLCQVDKWCLAGWPQRALVTIRNALDERWREWIDWPEQQLRDGLSVLKSDADVDMVIKA